MLQRKDAAYYRQYAARCFEIAREISGPDRKAALLEMAQAWLVLADLAEHSDELPQPIAQQQPQLDEPKKE